MAEENNNIGVNCRFAREQDLAVALGLPRQNFDEQMVYVVGYFQNSTREMGFILVEISLESELVPKGGGDAVHIFRKVSVEGNFVPPMNKGHLFVAKLDRVDLRCDVGKISPKITIKKVSFK